MTKYPVVGQVMIVNKGNNGYNWEKGCCFCKGKFGDDELFYRADIQYTYMRGDDEVFCYHATCKPQNLLGAISKL